MAVGPKEGSSFAVIASLAGPTWDGRIKDGALLRPAEEDITTLHLAAVCGRDGVAMSGRPFYICVSGPRLGRQGLTHDAAQTGALRPPRRRGLRRTGRPVERDRLGPSPQVGGVETVYPRLEAGSAISISQSCRGPPVSSFTATTLARFRPR